MVKINGQRVEPGEIEAIIKNTDGIRDAALKDFNVDGFIQSVRNLLPEGPRWFPEGMDTDQPTEVIIAEFIREKVLLNCRQEVPHSVGVTCDELTWKKGDHMSARCTILVEREGQKGIVVGAKGAMVKRIGMQARKDVERLLGCPVFLDLSVEVRPAWRRDANEVRRLGYDAGQ